MKNIDIKTVKSFGDEWEKFNQDKLMGKEFKYLFDLYFKIFPWNILPKNAKGFDMGCGSGRWAKLVAPKIGHLTCIDPSVKAINVAKNRLAKFSNIDFLNAGVSDKPLPINSQDFGYSLGVLHHIPDTESALQNCVDMLKPGAPFLVYLYYNFENRPKWYFLIWKLSNILRFFISNTPNWIKSIMTNFLAGLIYYPFARIALIGEKMGKNVDNWPLSSYRRTSFYTMRTDARDRFGTPLEKRFSRSQILNMMKAAGLEDIRFSNSFPFWCAVGKKKFKL
jgi:ubiquinone/menaquinone biosynthesis C-methylase UbiE